MAVISEKYVAIIHNKYVAVISDKYVAVISDGRRPKNLFFSAQRFLTISETKLQFLRPMFFH